MNAGAIIAATLGQAWAGIQRRHRDVPEAVVVVGPGNDGKKRKWGHFAPGRWSRGRSIAADTTHEQVHEVLLAGESLEREPAETFGTLLHEAAHALAEANGVKDTSRRGRYHNKRFKEFAERLGLDVAKDPRIGWSLTTMRPATVAEYAAEIEALRQAQEQTRQARRRWADELEKKDRKGRTTWSCQCKEPRTFAMGKKDAARGAIICELCESEFLEVAE